MDEGNIHASVKLMGNIADTYFYDLILDSLNKRLVTKRILRPVGVDIIRTERYLSMTPERFRKQLLKLSPQRHKKRRWRDYPALMKFLAQL